MKSFVRMCVIISTIFVLTQLFVTTDGLSATERQIVSEVLSDSLLAHVHRLVQFSPRLVGSGTSDDDAIGTDYDAALYLQSQLESYGLKSWVEEFSFDNWVLYEYGFLVDYDGDFTTTDDQSDMTGMVIPSRHRYTMSGQRIDIDTIARLRILSSPDIGDVKDAVVFADDELESKNENDVFKRIWDNGAAFNVVYTKGFPGTVERRWWKTFSIGESDFRLLETRATSSTRVHVIFKMEKKPIKAYNIVAMIPGRDEREVILTAHYDSPFNQGANDNASGTASLLEVARVLSKYDTLHPLYFVFTDGEEQGLFGAYDYVKCHGADIQDAVVINADCVGAGKNENLAVGISYALKGKEYPSPKEIDSRIAEVAWIITGYAPLPDYCPYACDDAFPFREVGIVATSFASTDTSNIHSSLDMVSNMNVEFLVAATKVLAVATHRLANDAELPPSHTPAPAIGISQPRSVLSLSTVVIASVILLACILAGRTILKTRRK